jgi:hypothetical protein
MRGVRDLIAAISPRWLSDQTTGVGAKLMYTIGLAIDAYLEKLNQGMRAHIPTYGDASALPLLAADRLLVQGPNESATSFASRLKFALDDWARAGSDRAVLRQLLGTVLPSTPQARMVSDSSVWNTYAASADTTQEPAHGGVATWNWDGLGISAGGSIWWRVWPILYSVAPQAFCTDEGVWGDGDAYGDDTKSWGLGVPSGTVSGWRAVVGQWKAAHAVVPWIVVSFDGTLLDPTGVGTNPDGTWGSWAKAVGGQWVAARAANARYCDGIT